jgi:hypothetical protein
MLPEVLASEAVCRDAQAVAQPVVDGPAHSIDYALNAGSKGCGMAP